jgi:transaldolase
MKELKQSINYSIWCDFIERDFLENEFQTMVEQYRINGATSNPAIFQNSIATSDAYQQQIAMLQANDTKKIYEELAITDIKRAATILKPLYSQDDRDGFISLEVDPALCDDSFATFEEGSRLYNQIGLDNVMIKVPATNAGYKAMEHLSELGISVNATLVFSSTQAIKSAEAIARGMAKSSQESQAVISVFVSRFDRLLDTELQALALPTSKTGIINATKCYHNIQKLGNNNIRTLFASTGVKGDELDPSYYIDNLILPNSVNTAPLNTIKAWEENGNHLASNIISEEQCEQYFDTLKQHNIDIDLVSKKLLNDGLESFKVSFQELLDTLKKGE